MQPMDLTGSIIVASPNVDDDSYFAKTVIYIVKYCTTEGTVGLIINHPLNKLENTLYVKDKEQDIKLKHLNVYSGGPVDTSKGFILHFNKKIQKYNHQIQITSSISMLKKMVQQRKQNKNSLFVFGYCGWDEGQIEEEICDNVWLVLANTDKTIVFDTKNNKKWECALESMNIRPGSYSLDIGRG